MPILFASKNLFIGCGLTCAYIIVVWLFNSEREREKADWVECVFVFELICKRLWATIKITNIQYSLSLSPCECLYVFWMHKSVRATTTYKSSNPNHLRSMDRRWTLSVYRSNLIIPLPALHIVGKTGGEKMSSTYTHWFTVPPPHIIAYTSVVVIHLNRFHISFRNACDLRKCSEQHNILWM